MEQGHDLLDTISVACHVKAAFSRKFLTLLRDKRDHVRFYGQGNFGHGLIGGHLQIELGTDEFPQEAKVAILDMAPIFSEMDDNTVGTGQFHQYGCSKGVRVGSATGLPQRGHMVDVYPKSWHGSSVLALESKEKPSCMMSTKALQL
jgi:hypothetical protein